MAPRRYVLAVTAVLIIAGAVLGWSWCRRRPAREGILAVFPVDGERAVVIATPSDFAHAAVALIERDGARRWRVDLGSHEPWLEDRRGATVTGDLVALRLAPARTIALGVADGSRRWTFDGAGLNAGPPPGVAVLADDLQVLAIHDAESTVIVALDRVTGSERWRWRAAGAPGAARRVWLRSTRLVVERGSGLDLVDRATGRVARVESAPAACVAGTAAYYLDPAGALHRIALADAADAVAIPSFPAALAGVAGTPRLAGLCGRRGDRTILAVDLDGARSAVVALEPDDTRVAWTVELGVRTLAAAAVSGDSQLRFRQPDAHPFAGELDRFVPVVTDEAGAPDEAPALALAVIDLERRAVAWRSRVDPQFLHGYLAAHRGRAYWVAGASLAVFDDATGHPRRAVRVGEGVPIQPHHFADGRVWVRDARRLGVIDAMSLELVRPGELQVTDVTADLAALRAH
jgi:hypothetical protein